MLKTKACENVPSSLELLFVLVFRPPSIPIAEINCDIVCFCRPFKRSLGSTNDQFDSPTVPEKRVKNDFIFKGGMILESTLSHA